MRERVFRFDPSSLPITHTILTPSTIWPESKRIYGSFPQGILRTDNLPVALVPRELAEYEMKGLRLFLSMVAFTVYYQRYDKEYVYYPPWLLFAFEKPDNKLTVPVSKPNMWKQESLI